MSVSVLTPTGWKSLGADPGWTRPADWLPMTVVAGQNKVQALIQVGTDTSVESNRVMTLNCAGNYTVDWGDGTAPQNSNTTIQINHLYDPATLGPATSEGFKQALITITPQGASILNNVNFSGVYYASKTWRSPVLEVVIGSSQTTTMTLGGVCPLVRRVEFKQPFTTTNPISQFSACYQLREVVGEVIINGNSGASFFSACYQITKFPKITFTALSGISVASFFSNCSLMVEAPLLNAPAGAIVNWASAFINCYSLKRLPAGFSLTGAATLSSTFSGCQALETLPLLDTAAATTLSGFCQNCYSLRKVSFTSTAATVNVLSMFSGCGSLESLTNLDFSNVTSANLGTWLGICYRLCELKFLPGKGPAFTWTVVGQMDAAGLNAIYTALPTVTGQTITVSGVGGGILDDPSIATAKGWTVSGT